MWLFRVVFMVLGVKILNALIKELKKAINEKLEGLKNDTGGTEKRES